MLSQWSVLGVELNYYHVVDIGIAGIIRVVHVFLVQRAGVVPVCVPAGGADAHLRAIFEIPDFPGKEKVHLVQCVHFGVPSGD